MSKVRLTKIATPSAPAANKAELFIKTADRKLATIDDNGLVRSFLEEAAAMYRLLQIIRLSTTPGTPFTYTPGDGTNLPDALYVECIGGGGAGGGAASSTGGTNNSVGGGGGGGAYSAKWVVGAAVKSSYTVTIGLGGTAGTAGSNPGNAGGDSTFDSPSICTAKGGSGGGAGGASGTALGGRGAPGSGGAAASGVGDLLVDGDSGDWGIVFSVVAATGMISGKGGMSAGGPGGGGGKAIQASAAGNPGLLYGGGGSGGADAAATNRVGGVGGVGTIRVWEFVAIT